MQLNISQDINNMVLANNEGRLDIIYHPVANDNPSGYKSIIKFKIDDMINAIYAGGLKLKFFTDSWEYIFQFKKRAFPLFNNNEYGMPMNMGTIAPNGTWIDAQRLVNCLRAGKLGQLYHINYIADGLFIYLMIEAKEVGNEYNMVAEAITVVNSTDTNLWTNGEFQTLSAGDDGVDADIKVWVRISMPKNGRYEEVYSNYSNIGTPIGDSDKKMYSFRGIHFVLRDYLEFEKITEPYRIIRDTNLAKNFKIEYWVEYNGVPKYIYESQLDTRAVLLAGAQRYLNEAKNIDITENFILNQAFGSPEQKLNVIAPLQPAWFSIYMPQYDDQAVIYIKYWDEKGVLLKSKVFEETDYSLFRGLIHFPVWLLWEPKWMDSEVLHSISLEIESSAYGQSDTPLMRYYIDYSNNENERWYYFVNSAGGIDSIRLYANKGEMVGVMSNEFEGLNGIENYLSHYNYKIQGNTENIDNFYRPLLIDMVRSRWIYEVDADTIWPTKLLPTDTDKYKLEYSMDRYALYQMLSRQILVTSKDLNLLETSNSLFNTKLEYKYAQEEINAWKPYESFGKIGKELLNQDSMIEINLYDIFSNIIIAGNVKGLNCQFWLNGIEVFPITTGNNEIYGQKDFQFPLVLEPNLTNYSLKIKGHLLNIVEISGECKASIIQHHLPMLKSFSFLFDKIELKDILSIVKKYANHPNISLEMTNHKTIFLDEVMYDIYKLSNKDWNGEFNFMNIPAVGLSASASSIKSLILARPTNTITINTD